MRVTIRKMTETEFEAFYQWSVACSTKELMEESSLSYEVALKETKKEVAQMLPHGLKTEHHQLMTVIEALSGEIAGFIWTLHEVTAGRKQNFVCDFVILESKRRKGYAQDALYLVEKQAAEAGCQESVLFVADRNEPAKALYKKCGYQFLRKMESGEYLRKQLQ